MKASTKILKYYEELAGAYQVHYESWLEQSLISLRLKGVYVEIKSEVIKYTRRTGKSPVEAENRLKIIDDVIRTYDYLLNESERAKFYHLELVKELNNLKKENQLMAEKLKNYEENYEEWKNG